MKPKYARAPVMGSASQLTQKGMAKPLICASQPKMIRRKCVIAIARNSAAVTLA